MAVLRDGTFDFTISSQELSLGLRPSKRNPRDSKYLITCIGAVGLDQVLQVVDDLENDRINTAVITDSFPYPQIFVFTNVTLICGETDIYEWDGSSLTHVIGPVSAGELWSAIDFFEFIWLSNRVVSITRSVQTSTYSTTTDQPAAGAMCNFNGQVVIGSPVEL